jgi:hypothetical protein
MNPISYENIIKYLIRGDKIDFKQSFDFAKTCSALLRNPVTEAQGREIVIRIEDAWERLEPKTYTLWNDICESAGLYPYLDSEMLSLSSLLRYEFHASPFLKDIELHEEQSEISLNLLSGNSVVLSAPTSFGKSLLIEEIVSSNLYKDIVIIQPTLALLDETRKKLRKYRDRYNIVVSTTQQPRNDIGNIFLFTGERVVDYQYFLNVDFFIIDEFYKLSLERDDERAATLNHALYKLLKLTHKFYFLGPNIKTIPPELINKYNPLWKQTEFSTVAVDEFPMEQGLDEKERPFALYKLLASLNEPTLIYCSSPKKSVVLANGFLRYLDTHDIDLANVNRDMNSDIIDWIGENIHPGWSLNQGLRSGVAFHNASLPRHLGSALVDSFNNLGIRYLFCTSTLIEGVNTSAKNVVLYDKAKGRKKIDFFDYKNIAGRSGRMFIHFVGRVFNFHPEPPELDIEVDIPAITQSNAPLELLIQLEAEDLKQPISQELAAFEKLENRLKTLIKRNSGVPVEGQIEIAEIIEKNIIQMAPLLDWKGFPNYEQLELVIDLLWEHLIKNGESKAEVVSSKQLAYLTSKYIETKSVQRLIYSQFSSGYWERKIEDPQERLDDVTFFVLNITRHWFDYKLPRLITAISSLQQYVLENNNRRYGDYSLIAQQLENGFIHSVLAILLEYDIPQSAIKKLMPYVPNDLDAGRLLEFLKTFDLEKCGLIPYEIKKIKAII